MHSDPSSTATYLVGGAFMVMGVVGGALLVLSTVTGEKQRKLVDGLKTLGLLDSAIAPRTTLQNPLRWASGPQWRLDYLNLSRLTPAEIAERRAANDRIKQVAQGVRDATLAGQQS